MRFRCLCLLASLAAVLAGLPVKPSHAANGMSKEAVTTSVEKAHGVKVLRIEEADHNGTPIYLVTVMNPAGDFNAAFQVTRLAVDRASGNLVSQYRTTPTGQVHSGAETRTPTADGSGTLIRQQTHRQTRP